MSSHGHGSAAVDRRQLFDPRVVHFLRHLGEMTLAMMIGMAALTGLFEEAFGFVSGGALRNVELTALGMATGMTLPMAAWMRHRGHGWRATVEMSAAMIVPAVALLVVLRAGGLPGDSILSMQHALMLPSMIGAMLVRRREYLC